MCDLYARKAIEKAIRDKESLARSYDVSVTSIVWINDNKYIVIKDGKEIRI